MFQAENREWPRTCVPRPERHPCFDRTPILELDDEGIYRAVLPNPRRAEHYMSVLITRSARPVEDVDASIFLG